MLGDILIELRSISGLNQKDLSVLTGISFKNIILLESGDINLITTETYDKLNIVFSFSKDFKKKYVSKYNHLGEIIKEKRLQKKLSLGQLQNLTNISRQKLSSYELGHKKTIRFETFKKLEGPLNLKIEEFMPFISNPQSFKSYFVNDGLFNILVNEKRVKLKLSKKQLSIIANIDNSLISKIENNKVTTITVRNANKLMEALKFTEEEQKRYIKRKNYSFE